jgi:hypothetical protein
MSSHAKGVWIWEWAVGQEGASTSDGATEMGQRGMWVRKGRAVLRSERAVLHAP